MKLTHEELNEFGVFNLGIICVKGTPKKRRTGMNCYVSEDGVYNYESEEVEDGHGYRVELVPTADEGKYAFRIFNVEGEEYLTRVQPLEAVSYIK